MLRRILVVLMLLPVSGFCSDDGLYTFDEELPDGPAKHIQAINDLLDEYRYDELESYASEAQDIPAPWDKHIAAYLAYSLIQEEKCYETASNAGFESELPDSIRSKWLVIASRCYGISETQ